MRSIFFKIFAGYLLITGALTTSILLFSFKTVRNHHINTLTDNLYNLGTGLNLKITPLLEENQYEKLDSMVKDLGKQIKTRITIIEPGGIVLADSEKNPKLMENHRTRPEIIQALKGKTGKSVRYSTTVKEEMLYVALPMERGGKILGVLRVSLFLKDINRLLNRLKLNLFYIAMIVLVISLLGALVFSRSLSKPIRELSVASRRVASGDFDVRVFLRRRDELRDLADNFNYMAGQIKKLFAELSGQKEELNSIISYLQEGLMVVDKGGKIILTNESFEKIVKSNHIDGKFYWEVVRNPKFGELMKKVAYEKRNLVEEVEFYNRFFLCSATFLKLQEEVVVILHDITEIKNLEKIKKDFVVNASHELRTPLTAIKGFTETLEEVDEKNQHYLDIIKRHTDRLINIVDDLILLEELEERGTKLELEEVDVKDVVANVLKIFEPKLKEKNLVVKSTADDNLLAIRADPFKLEQLFLNLIDNAIKYTEKGEIRIALKQRDDQIMIEIADTGIGISEEHQPRVFERFYVVDKARSRRFGGTGLGLAIAKHIVLLHNGTIDLESSPGVGTKFKIILPVNPSKTPFLTES